MRFEDVGHFTEVSVERVRQQFRHETIQAVLPVAAGSADSSTLLVATAEKLAIVTSDADDGDAWFTQWAPWGAVGFADDAGDAWDAGDEEGAETGVYRLTVLVDTRPFHAQLAGDAGRAALRDFVVAAQTSRTDAASRR